MPCAVDAGASVSSEETLAGVVASVSVMNTLLPGAQLRPMGKRVSPAVLPTAFSDSSETAGRFTLMLGVVTMQVMGTTAALAAVVGSVLAMPVLQPQVPEGVKVTVT